MRFKLDLDTLSLGSSIERVIRVPVKDIFRDSASCLIVVVDGKDVGKAVGKGGEHIKKLSNKLDCRVRVVGYSDDACTFVKNLIMPVKVASIRLDEKKIIIEDESKKAKSLLIGRGGQNLLVLKRALTRFFPELDIEIR